MTSRLYIIQKVILQFCMVSGLLVVLDDSQLVF